MKRTPIQLLVCHSAVFVLLFAGTLPAPVFGQDAWVGGKFMPAEQFRPQIGEREVSPLTLTYPLVVEKVDGDWLWVGKAWVKKQHVVAITDAPDYYTAYLRRFPNSSSVYNMRGLAYTELGEWDEALTDFTQALRMGPEQPAIIYSNRGMVWHNLEKYDRAISDFDEALRLNPQSAVAIANRAWTRLMQEDYQQAADDYTRALAIDPQYPNAHFNRGTCRFALGENDTAIEDFTAAIEQAPRYAAAYYNRGAAWLNNDEFDRAISDFTAALRWDDENTDAYNDRGVAWYRKGDYDRAIADFTEAVRRDNENALAFHNRSEAWYLKGDYGATIDDYRQTARLTPDDPNIWSEIAWMLATCPEARYRDGRQAVATATRACELSNWQDGNYLDTLAAAYAEDGNFERAVHWQRRAVDVAVEETKNEYSARLELYTANKPYRHTPPASAAEPKPPRQLAVGIAAGRLTINGTQLKLPCRTADLEKALGQAANRQANSLDPLRPPNRLIWDDLGIFVLLSVVVGEDRYDTESVEAIYLLFAERSDVRAWPKRTFDGTLIVDGTPFTASSTIDEINRQRRDKPFKENPNNGSFSLQLEGLRLSLEPTDFLTRAVSNIQFKGLFVQPHSER